MNTHPRRILSRLALLAALVSPAITGSLAHSAIVNVTGSTLFNSGVAGALGSWDHTFTLGAPGIRVQQITILLNASLFFDATGAAPGFAVSQDVAPSAGAASTGFVAFSHSGASLNGGSTLTLGFTGFDAGELFSHQGDVDEVQTLQNCTGLGIAAAIACAAANVAAALDGSLVSGAEFAGSSVNVTLGGPALAVPVTLSGSFVNLGGNRAEARWSGTVSTVPAPATAALSLLALGALAGVRLSSRRQRPR